MNPPFDPEHVPPTLDRRAFVGVGAGALGLSLLAGGASAGAGAPATGDAGPALAPRYPLHNSGGDAFAELMAYAPDKDPDAAFFRCYSPRATAIAPFAPTQAHPRLDPRPRAGALVAPYLPLDGRLGSGFSRMRAGRSPPGKVFVPRLSAVYDLVVGWGGTGMIPNPAMVDLAHRNGALALGTVFQPDRRLYDSSAAPASAVAAKLVSLARYFGFDGYFVNFENGDARSHAQVLELIVLMRHHAAQDGDGAFHVQFYDGHTDLVRMEGLDAHHTPPADSVMLDQGWSGYAAVPGCCSGAPVSPRAVHAACQAQGLDPFATAYFGLQLYPGPGFLSVAAPLVVAPNGEGPAYGSLQVYSADDGLRKLLQVARTQTPQDADAAGRARRERRLIYTLERRMLSGGSQNPALDNRPTAAEARAYAPNLQGLHIYTHFDGAALRPHDQAALPISYGLANFVAERSVIGATPFLTRFNTGEGDGFWIGGERVGTTPWFDMGAQDLLPTWQWRREPMKGRLDPAGPQPRLLEADFDLDAAFEGGASLRLSGPLDAVTATRLWLYKTALTLSPAETLRLVHRGAGEGVWAAVGLVFEDAPEGPEWLPFAGADADGHNETLADGWTRTTIPIAPFAGRTVAAILLGVAPEAAGREPIATVLSLGELFVGPAPDPADAPPAPRGLTVLACAPAPNGRSAAVRLSWEYAAGTAYYDVFHTGAGPAGRRTWLGRINGDHFYTADAPLAGGDRLEVVAVARDRPMTPSAPARIEMRQTP